mgnify:CR=1 FL=1
MAELVFGTGGVPHSAKSRRIKASLRSASSEDVGSSNSMIFGCMHSARAIAALPPVDRDAPNVLLVPVRRASQPSRPSRAPCG